MKKTFVMIPLLAAAVLAASCTSTPKKKKKKSSSEEPVPTSVVPGPTSEQPAPTSVTPGPTSIGPGPVSDWPAVPQGDGTEANPYNVTQARAQALTQEQTADTKNQDKYLSPTPVYVRGYVCVIEDIAINRPRKAGSSTIDNDVKFYLADDGVSVNNEQVGGQACSDGFGVYFARNINDTNWNSYQEACDIYGRLVVVKGYLINWKFVPEVTGKSSDACPHPVMINIGEKSPTADPNYQPLVTEEQSRTPVQ